MMNDYGGMELLLGIKIAGFVTSVGKRHVKGLAQRLVQRVKLIEIKLKWHRNLRCLDLCLKSRAGRIVLGTDSTW